MPISANALNRLSQEVSARTLSYGRLGLPHHRANGTLLFRRPTGLDPAPRRPGGRRGAPFDIAIENRAGDLYATFRPGMINQLLPDNYLAGVLVSATGTKYLVLNCTASNGAITGATFAAEDAPPAALAPYAGQPPTAFAVLIGLVVDSVAIKVWGDGNIQALGQESFRLQKSVPVAGQVPYDVYYTWATTLM